MNQDGFSCFLKAFTSYLLEEAEALFTSTEYYIALDGINEKQRITITHPCDFANFRTGIKEECFTLVITMQIIWENQIPKLAFLTNVFHLTDFGTNLKVNFNNVEIPLKQVLNKLFREVCPLRKELLEEINRNTENFFTNKLSELPLPQLKLSRLPPSQPYFPPTPADMMGGYY